MRTLLITAITSLAFIGTALAGPIHDAVRDGDVAKVRQLLANGAKVEARVEDGWTPLHLAVKWGTTAIAKVLIKAGAKINARNKNVKTPLHDAASADIAMVLLAAGADVDARGRGRRYNRCIWRPLLTLPRCCSPPAPRSMRGTRTARHRCIWRPLWTMPTLPRYCSPLVLTARSRPKMVEHHSILL